MVIMLFIESRMVIIFWACGPHLTTYYYKVCNEDKEPH